MASMLPRRPAKKKKPKRLASSRPPGGFKISKIDRTDGLLAGVSGIA